MPPKSFVSQIFCDGGARGNPGPAAIGFVVKDKAGNTLARLHQVIGPATNNVAEYQAVIAALDWLGENKPRISPSHPITFILDSVLVANQLQGNYKIKEPHLQVLAQKVNLLRRTLPTPLIFTSVPRSFNKEADALVNQALDE